MKQDNKRLNNAMRMYKRMQNESAKKLPSPKEREGYRSGPPSLIDPMEGGRAMPLPIGKGASDEELAAIPRTPAMPVKPPPARSPGYPVNPATTRPNPEMAPATTVAGPSGTGGLSTGAAGASTAGVMGKDPVGRADPRENIKPMATPLPAVGRAGYAKGGSVRGWGQARGARKAKII